ncbi:MAG: C-terminal binding protein [Verrucomicrobia bacterium]|nr:C-terminal binding protein [Verrucomicrobiota bacterium]
MPYKIVVTDYSFPDLSIEQEILAPFDVTWETAQCRTIEEVTALTRDATVIIAQFAPVRAATISTLKNTRAIIRYGIGVDNVDLAAAAAQKIPVCNVPDYCLDEVAEHTLAFVLALTRQVVANAVVISGGEWKSAVPIEGYRCLKDMTVGVVGFGRIGRGVIQRLIPFGCRVVVFDPMVPASAVEAMGAKQMGLEDLLARSDLVTLHCPSLPSTKGMINQAALQRMKRGSLLVNASRGDLIVTDDLVAALRSGQIAGAALDVTSPEPLPKESPLRTMPQVIISPHVASATPQAGRRLRESVANLAVLAVQGKPLKNVVNGV